MTPAATAVQFAFGYTALGVLTVVEALILLRGEESHRAISMVCLYVCTIVTGERIWALWFAIDTNPSCFCVPGRYWLNWYAVTRVRSTSLLIAWPFMALAGHCFLSASGCLVRLWSTLRNRVAVVLCGVTLCVGLLSPLRMLGTWHAWFTKELPRLAETCSETRRLTDEYTEQWAKECPSDWQVLLVRAHYLFDVGRSNEARAVAAEALRLLPSEKAAVRSAITEDMQRAESAHREPGALR